MHRKADIRDAAESDGKTDRIMATVAVQNGKNVMDEANPAELRTDVRALLKENGNSNGLHVRDRLGLLNPFAKQEKSSFDQSHVSDVREAVPPDPKYSGTSSGDSSANDPENVFGEGLRIEGNVFSDTGIVVRGKVCGNIRCHGDIELSGFVRGDIEGRNIRIIGGSVEGNIACSESLNIERSTISGNITARQAQINNKIEGNITVRGTLALLHEADITGDIAVGALSIEEGAVLSGKVTVTPGEEPGLRSEKGGRPTSVSEREVVPEVRGNEVAVTPVVAVQKTEETLLLSDMAFSSTAAVIAESDGVWKEGIRVDKIMAFVGIAFWGGLLLWCMFIGMMHRLDL